MAMLSAVAMTDKFKKFESQAHHNHITYTVILSNSHSMLRKIEKFMLRKEWAALLEKSKVKDITWIYSLGHAGMRDNERADA